MSKTALITLSAEGLQTAIMLKEGMGEGDLYLHRSVGDSGRQTIAFDSTASLTAEIFSRYRGLIYIMPGGVVTRALTPHIESKFSDPAVVVLDVRGRWAVSLLSGHEGGANRLAEEAAWILDGEPIITTTSEAVRTLIAGVGCRRGVPATEILSALHTTLNEAGLESSEVRLIASADIKKDEIGIHEAAQSLSAGVRFIGSERIREACLSFDRSEFVEDKVNLPAVAEPAALLAGSRTCLIVKKKKFPRVTIALARENSLSSASARGESRSVLPPWWKR